MSSPADSAAEHAVRPQPAAVPAAVRAVWRRHADVTATSPLPFGGGPGEGGTSLPALPGQRHGSPADHVSGAARGQ